ncbi:hypothetical protein F4814DRAFT_453087 [Daldinia grandis]|nr:hypothetical protein F4814DRAFT_453087 [Daldinia grandis]
MAQKLTLTPLTSLRVSRHFIPAHGLIPNTSIQNKPLLHYHEAFPPSTLTASAIESHLTSVGIVDPQWRFTMYSTTHFHSTTHELLCVSSGNAKLCFGGEDNPGKVEKEDLTGEFEMVGSYLKGYNWDMCYGKKGEEVKIRGIQNLPWFEKDPIYGSKGPVLEN